jgi:hypothetical protein
MALGGAISIDSGSVLVLITLVVLPIAAIAFARSGPAWRGIGKGPFSIEHDPAHDRAQGAGRELPRSQLGQLHQISGPLDRKFDAVARGEVRGQSDAVQRAEVRQMIEAKSYRRQQRGEPPLDVEAETERELADLIGSA